MLKAFRFWIFGVILMYTVWFQIGGAQPLYKAWKVHLKYPVVEASLIFSAVIITAGFAVGLYTGLLRWQKRPRFMPIRGDGPQPRKFVVFPIMFPIVVGLMTLAKFDLYQCVANNGLHDSSTLASPTEVLVFNLVVVLVYTAFTIRTIGILARRRKKYGMDKE